jgi:hypothetical protein
MLFLVLFYVPMVLFPPLLIRRSFSYTGTKVTIQLLVYVDDIIVISSSPAVADKLVQGLRSQFVVNDLGRL